MSLILFDAFANVYRWSSPKSFVCMSLTCFLDKDNDMEKQAPDIHNLRNFAHDDVGGRQAYIG